MEQSKCLTVKREPFGKVLDGISIELFTLSNSNGITVKITNYGGIITSIITPDTTGRAGDIVLGFDSIEDYLKPHPYFGCIVGRYANRIAEGKFKVEGQEYSLAKNNGPNHLHGGIVGFDKVVWEVKEVTESDNEASLKLAYLSKDGEEGYPGNLSVTVSYSLTNDNQLIITYDASTDKTTPINLTNHSYFNLSAGQAKNCLDHVIKLNADKYVEVNDQYIPTGNLVDVASTPMDFTNPHPIGEFLDKVPGGYDHTYVIKKEGTKEKMAYVAWVHEPLTNRIMEVYSTQPGAQFYIGNFLDGTLIGKNDIVYNKHYGFCLETHHFPDSPNQPSFPSAWLHPGEKFNEITIYKFSTKSY